MAAQSQHACGCRKNRVMFCCGCSHTDPAKTSKMCGKTKTQGGYLRYCSGVEETITRYHRDRYCDKPHHQRLRFVDRDWKCCRCQLDYQMRDECDNCAHGCCQSCTQGRAQDVSARKYSLQFPTYTRSQDLVSTSSLNISPLVLLSNAAQQRLQVPYPGLSAKDFHSSLINPLVQGRSQRPLPGPTSSISRPSTTIQARPHGPGSGPYPPSSSSPTVRIVLRQPPQAPYESPPPVGSQPSTISMRQARSQRQQPGSGSQQPIANPGDVNIRRPQISDEAPSSNDSERSLPTATEEGSLRSDRSLTTITQSRSLSPLSSSSSGRVQQALSGRKRNRD